MFPKCPNHILFHKYNETFHLSKLKLEKNKILENSKFLREINRRFIFIRYKWQNMALGGIILQEMSETTLIMKRHRVLTCHILKLEQYEKSPIQTLKRHRIIRCQTTAVTKPALGSISKGLQLRWQSFDCLALGNTEIYSPCIV